MPKAILFLRVSTQQQSTESQKTSLIHLAKADGFTEDDIIFIDKKESGYMLDEFEREGIKELYDTMEKEDVSDVYVWELSRLSRRPKVLYSMRDVFLNKKIQLHCEEPYFRLLNSERDGIDANATVLFALFGAMAEQEVNEIKARFDRGRKTLAEAGRFNGGAIPFGYRVDKEQMNLIIEDEKEGQIVRDIYNLYERGFSQLDIAKEMILRGEKGRAVKGTKSFTLSLVHQILTNELLTGKEHITKKGYVRRYPQIITQEQYERCRKIAEKNNTNISKTKRPYYSRGLIVCTMCGRKFTSTGEKGFYHCQDTHNEAKAYDGYFGEKRCENKLTISYNVIDSILWEIAKVEEARFLTREVEESHKNLLAQKADLRTKIHAIPGRLKLIENKRQHLLEAYVEGMEKNRYERKKEAISKEKAAVLKDKNSFQEELCHVDELIRDLEIRAKKVGLTLTQQMHARVNDYKKLRIKLSKIEDDNERIKLIHKHIRCATVEDVLHKCTFGIHPDGKMSKARKISVWTYHDTDPDVFIFIPFDGKGGHVIQEARSDDGSVVYTDFPVQFFTKRYDMGKYVRREKERQNKASKIEELKSKGYLTIEDMVKLSGMSESSVRNAFTEGKIKNWVKIGIKRLAPRIAFEEYLEKYSPTPRPSSAHKKSK